MPRSSEQNQRLKQERREQIMQEALKVFARKGLAATKISDIAAACDLSYGLIYHYFHDKDELYFALVERALQGALQLTTTARERPGPAWERLRTLCADMIAGFRAAPEYFQIILQALLSEQPPSAVYTLAARYGEHVLADLTSLIRQAQNEGQVVPIDASELAFTLIAMIQGLSLSQAFNYQIPGLFPSVETVVRFLRPSIPLEEDSHHAG